MNKLEIMPRRALKNGIASAIIHAINVSPPISPSQIPQAFLEFTKRSSDSGKTRPMMYLPTTVVLMAPEMKTTGSAIPKATRDTTFEPESIAGLLTLLPTKE